LEFGGYIEKVLLPPLSLNDIMIVSLDNVKLALRFLEVSFDNYAVKLEAGENDKNKWIDIVFYSGEEKAISFKDLKKAFLIFAIYISEKADDLSGKFSDIEFGEKEERVLARWLVDGNMLEIEANTKPDSISKLLKESRALINGMPVEKEG